MKKPKASSKPKGCVLLCGRGLPGVYPTAEGLICDPCGSTLLAIAADAGEPYDAERREPTAAMPLGWKAAGKVRAGALEDDPDAEATDAADAADAAFEAEVAAIVAEVEAEASPKAASPKAARPARKRTLVPTRAANGDRKPVGQGAVWQLVCPCGAAFTAPRTRGRKPTYAPGPAHGPACRTTAKSEAA